jgi:hypothetical protein
MRTAEEWYEQNENSGNEDGDGNQMPYEYTVTDIKQIQLDALKEGMRRAAGLCDADFYEHNECRKAILTAAEQLTMKGLDIRTNNSL